MAKASKVKASDAAGDVLSAHFASRGGWGMDDDDWGTDDPDWRMSALRARPSALGRTPKPGERPVVTLGWHADLPDLRDRPLPAFATAKPAGDKERDERDEELMTILKKKKSVLLATGALPDDCLNIQYCSPVEDQGQLGSCTAQAVVGLMEYMMRRGRGTYTDGSRLFLYKVTRNLLHWTGDTGAYIRTAVKAAVTFGVPPEEYWAYDVVRFDDEPSAFLYSFAASYQAVNYARLDTPGTGANDVIERVRRTLAAGFGVVLGFSVYDSLTNDANIPVPNPRRDKLQGGHAVMAVGYDMKHKVNGTTVPSLVIRNSWGARWGRRGYGYLPLEFVTLGLARDFWTVYDWEWIRDGDF